MNNAPTFKNFKSDWCHVSLRGKISTLAAWMKNKVFWHHHMEHRVRKSNAEVPRDFCSARLCMKHTVAVAAACWPLLAAAQPLKYIYIYSFIKEQQKQRQSYRRQNLFLYIIYLKQNKLNVNREGCSFTGHCRIELCPWHPLREEAPWSHLPKLKITNKNM